MTDRLDGTDNRNNGLLLDPVLQADFLDAIPGQVALVDATGRITAVNGNWRHFAQCNGGRDTVGTNYLAVCKDSSDGQAVADGLSRILAGETKHFTWEYPCHSAETRRWFRCFISPLHDSRGDRLMGAMVLHADITERKVEQERADDYADRVRLIADALPALVSYTDKDLRLRFVNRRYEIQYGVPASQLVGMHLSSVFGANGVDIIAEHLRKVLAGEPVEFEGQVADSDRWYHAHLVPHRDQDEIHGYFALIYDITAAKQTQEELNKARQQAEMANLAKSDFLASMSHELRTPLNSVIGFAEMLASEVWGPLGHERYRTYARDIQDSGGHLLTLINDVLDLSKIEAGRFELHEEDVVLPEMVESCAHMMRERARRYGVTIDMRIPDDLPVLRADGRLIRQILLNLFSNAIKFTPEGGTVTATIVPAPDGGLDLTVRDTGIGIAAQDIPKAFEPFGQLDSDLARRHNKNGTGLGLPLSRQFVELHGGTLRLESAVGKGTAVTVHFPLGRLIAG